MLHVIAGMLTTTGSSVPRNYYKFPKWKAIWTWNCVVQITFSSWLLLKEGPVTWIESLLTTEKQIMSHGWRNKTINVLRKLLAVNCKCALFLPFICFIGVLFIFIIKSFLNPQGEEVVHNTFWFSAYLPQGMQGIHSLLFTLFSLLSVPQLRLLPSANKISCLCMQSLLTLRGNLLLTLSTSHGWSYGGDEKNKQRSKLAMLNTVAEREAVIPSGAEEKGMQFFAAVHMNTHFFGTLNNDTSIIWVGDSLCSIGLHWLQGQDAYMWWFIHYLYAFIMVTEVKNKDSSWLVDILLFQSTQKWQKQQINLWSSA